MRRLTAALCALLLLCFVCLPCPAEDAAIIEEENADPEAAFPELNAEGFLDSGEFLYENEKDGVWRYAGATLKVEIYRRTSDKPKLVWYEAEVWSRDGDIWHMIPNNADKWMTSIEYPYKIARKNQTVLAINSDYAQLRISQKKRVGIVIRSGRVISGRTVSKNRNQFPNLDTLAIFRDGNMSVRWSDELTAEEYTALGANDVLAFGPYLIRDGELNEAALRKYGSSRAPRTAIGMVSPGHYWAVMAEGRHSASVGTSVQWMGEKLYELGCTVGFNLDGGQTSCIVFMGKQLCRIGKNAGSKASARKTADILGIGTSALCAEMPAK